ncbi:MAG: MaoC family dehydratase [Sandaracinaceae bacterium]|nr:MaoC family dehydratase [Sandaracinaceae bacterium]
MTLRRRGYYSKLDGAPHRRDRQAHRADRDDLPLAGRRPLRARHRRQGERARLPLREARAEGLPDLRGDPRLRGEPRALRRGGRRSLGVVHGSQKIVLHRPFAPEGKLVTVGIVEGIHDLKRMAQSTVRTETRDESGALVCETEWTIMYLKDGGFGGDPPPKSPKIRPPERAPDWVVEDPTTPEQALLYRLSGDHNPLHADPAAAELAAKVTEGRPILHGLCTYGYVGRAILQKECGSDPSRLRALYGRFSRPIWPGETIVTEGWREDGRVIVRAAAKERPSDHVFTNAYAELA